MKEENFYMLAKTMYGLEEILAEELRTLGAQNVKIQNRAVSFKGDIGFMYKANLNLRTCLRILKPIATFQAHNEKELLEKITKIDWSTLSLDSSGYSLHKRGYKSNTVVAPMNEVLAAGLILLSGWNQISDFHDPMCGSGTILIEAALIANNIPANIFRDKFGFASWKDYDEELFELIRDTSLNKEKEYKGKITGGDNFQKAVRMTRENVENALMFESIKVKNEDFFETKISPNTFVLFNPPYGERIELGMNEFYEKLGTSLKNNYQDCDVWLISSDLENLKMIGLKPNKKIKVMNGKLECSFRKFEIYSVSKKASKNNE